MEIGRNGWYSYTARSANTASVKSGESAMEAGDVIVVAASMMYEHNVRPENPTGYVKGYNQRTREQGFFPGTFNATTEFPV